MRTRTLDPLFSRPVQEILATVLLVRDEPWYLSDLAKRVRRAPSTLQRPLQSLVQAGILRRWADGNRVYFETDSDCPFLPELRGLIAKTIGLVDVLRDVLRPHSRSMKVAFVYGSVASGKERSRSDVDLLIIGSLGLADISCALAKAESRLGRPVNVTLLPPKEFSQRIADKNHFLRSVLANEKIFVVGTTHDLEEIAKPRARRGTRHEQIRAR